MALPTGSGSEILKSSLVNNIAGSAQALTDLIDLTASGIWIATVLSVSVCNMDANENGFINLSVITTGSVEIQLVHKHPLSFEQTFVWNDPVVIQDGEKFAFSRETAAGTYDIVCSYILQDWS